MRLNQAGIDLIKAFEGCKLKAYPDPATKGAPWTIGYGHTGPQVRAGTVWTQAQAEIALTGDLAGVGHDLTQCIKAQLTDNEFSACVSLAYNIGMGNFKSSTLLKLLNTGHIDAAAEEFLKWNKAAGQVMPGLTTRRMAEKLLFQTL